MANFYGKYNGIFGGGGGGGGGTSVTGSGGFIWQPGGVAGGNVYTTWATLYAAILPFGVAAIDVCCDNTFSSTFNIPAGTYALGNTTLQAPVGLAPNSPVMVTCQDGCIFSSFPIVTNLVNLTTVSTTPVFTSPAGQTYLIFINAAGMITNTTGAAPLISVPTGSLLFLVLNALSSAAGAVGHPVVDLVGTAQMFVPLGEGTSWGDNSVTGAAGSSVIYIVENPNVTLSTTQPGFLGTTAIQYSPDITNISIGSVVGNLAYSTTNGQGAILPIGTTGQALIVVGGLPVWGTPSGSAAPYSRNTPISNGTGTVSVVFTTPMASTPNVVATIQNTVNGTPDHFTVVISAVATTGFTAQLSAVVPNANYSLNWIASVTND